METVLNTVETPKIEKKGTFFRRFFYSDCYLLILSALIFVAWYLEKEQLAIVGAVTLGCIVLCVQEDTLPILPIIFMAPLTFPHNVDPMVYWQLLFYFIPIPFAIIFHFVRFRPKKVKLGKMFIPQLLVSVALLLGGIGVMTLAQWKEGLTYALMLGLLILVLYVALGLTMHPPKDVDTKRYIMAVLMYMGLVLVAETFVFFMRTEQDITFWATRNLDLGWGISNNVATLLLLSAPACFYLALQSKYCSPIYMLIGLIQFVGIFFTFSRGGILAACVVLPLTVLYAGCVAKNKWMYWIAALVLAIGAGVALFLLRDKWLPLLQETFKSGFDGSGRDKLYYEAWDGFMANPVFGLGIGHRGPYYTVPNVPMYWFHSTAFQIVGSMGAVGLVAYVVYYIARFGIVIRWRPFNIMMFICMLGFEGYSMIDTGTFVPVPCMLIVILLTLVTERVNEAEPKRQKKRTSAKNVAAPLENGAGI